MMGDNLDNVVGRLFEKNWRWYTKEERRAQHKYSEINELTKKCGECGEEKLAILDFFSSGAGKYSLQSICRKCNQKYNKRLAKIRRKRYV